VSCQNIISKQNHGQIIKTGVFEWLEANVGAAIVCIQLIVSYPYENGRNHPGLPPPILKKEEAE